MRILGGRSFLLVLELGCSVWSPSLESLEVVGDARVTSGNLELVVPKGEDPRRAGAGGIKGDESSSVGVVDGDDPFELSPSFFFLFLPSFLNQLVAFPPILFSSSAPSPGPRPKPINRSALFEVAEGESVTIVIVDRDLGSPRPRPPWTGVVGRISISFSFSSATSSIVAPGSN